MKDTRFHELITLIGKPERFTYPFYYEPHPLSCLASKKLQEYLSKQLSWRDELSKGKMFGVLVVEDKESRLGFLAAYSGLLLGRNDHSFFVPAVFDSLSLDGHFKKEEKKIDAITKKITNLLSSKSYDDAVKKSELLREALKKDIDAYFLEVKASKLIRDTKRKESLSISKEEHQLLIKESQFMKAELKRKKKRALEEQALADRDKNAIEMEISRLKQLRKTASDELQHWLFSQYVMLNAKKEMRDLLSIFADTKQKVPPAGAGDCCAPKLLQYAYLNDFRPIAMAEFWWGASPKNELRRHLGFYPACRGKCLPILNHMLEGLDVEKPRISSNQASLSIETVYEDEWLKVVNKPSGMITVRGKTMGLSLEEILQEQAKGEIFIVHRLDMDTSGLIVVAKSLEVYRSLQKQFSLREVKKRYVALLQGHMSKPSKGRIDLPLRADPLDRPYQKVDALGKKAITEYEILSTEGDLTRIALYPLTGRTHQLRVHCAHADGLGVPILGDRLYGESSSRLYLHAEEIEFTHPKLNKKMKFFKKGEF
ncbi:MAG: pseudouridine synthase [Prevotella sp.]|nr:pseudouridine synthase [Prevotella sp.]